MSTTLQRKVYFSAADRQLEGFLGIEDFERSLLLNTLFQVGMLVPDIFCFISKRLHHHLLRSRRVSQQSLFEAGLERNLISIAFRQSFTSFPDALGNILKTGIHGVREEASKMIAGRLQATVDLPGADFQPVYWPGHSVGEKFSEVVKRLLWLPEVPDMEANPAVNKERQRNWKLTEKWRLDCIAEAEKRSRGGLRRGEIMNAVGRQLGLPDGHAVNDVRELFRLAKSGPERHALRVFCGWVTECYQYNQAEEFQVIHNCPKYNPNNNLIVTDNLMSEQQSEEDPRARPLVKITVAIPPIKLLLRVPAGDIIRIREELGKKYLTDLVAWQNEPTESNEAILRKSLQGYAKEIVDWSRKTDTFKTADLDVIIGKGWVRTVGEFVEHVPYLGSIVAALVTIGRPLYTAYMWRSQAPEDTTVEVRAPRRVLSEVNLQKRKTQ
jgi:hypothetical protein